MINIYNKSRGKCKEKGMIINMSRELFERLEEMDVEVKDTIERLMGDEELYTEYLLQFPVIKNIGLQHKI